MDKIKTKALLEMEFCGRKHAVETESITTPLKIEIECEKPCDFVLENDKIKYVYKVKNLSEVTLHDTVFKSTLDKQCDYVPGSFTINGRPHKVCVRGNILECGIRELKACEILTVVFEAKTNSFRSNCGFGSDNDNNGDNDFDNCNCNCRPGNFVHGSLIG